MNKHRKELHPLLGLLMAVVFIVSSCNFPGMTLSTPTPRPTATDTPVPGSLPLLGDFGDAPDGDYNMDTGYYAFTGGPWVWNLTPAGVPADFPTMGRDQVPGPYMLDVDEFWIGPLLAVFSGDDDEPSIEDDADDLNDPDGIPNILANGNNADCDRENGFHNPAGTGCAPQPPYSIPMNARLLIFAGAPPLGIWITTIHASEDMSYNGPVYWNLLYDMNQNGNWEDGPEWVARDIRVDLQPGESETLISPAFRFPTSGNPWGRLRFPNWARSMVTSVRMQDVFNGQHWDGRGIEGGFEVGEVEDYFVEWRPIGQRFPNQGGGGGDPRCQLVADNMLEELPPPEGTEGVMIFMPGDNVTQLEFVFGDMDPEYGGAVQSRTANLDEQFCDEELGCFECNAETGYCTLQIPEASPGDEAPRIVVIYPSELNSDCSGTGLVGMDNGVIGIFFPVTDDTLVDEWVFWAMFEVFFDVANHAMVLRFPDGMEIIIILGSITIKGEHPFVEVSGEYDKATGEFSAEGTGTVAGFPNIKVTFTGTVDENSISGEYTMGADGGLPGGQPIIYSVEGERTEGEPKPTEEITIEPGPRQVDPGMEDAIQSFIEVFNNAFESGDPDPLYQLLHPAVGEIYGEEACMAYIESIISTPTSLEYLGSSYVGEWVFERDGAAIPVDFAYAVQANFTANDQTTEQELHLVLPGDDSVRWFTDCGEPLSTE